MINLIFLPLLAGFIAIAKAQNCFDLNNVNVMTFRENLYTAYRSSAPIKQLDCRSDYYSCQSHPVHVAECRIAAYDRSYGSPRWTCTSPDLPPNVFLKNFVVSCEKCSTMDTCNKLMGSCGLRYEIGIMAPPSINHNLGGGVINTVTTTISHIFIFLLIILCCGCGCLWWSCCGFSTHSSNHGYTYLPPPSHHSSSGGSGHHGSEVVFDNHFPSNYNNNNNTTFMYAPAPAPSVTFVPSAPPVAQVYSPAYESYNSYGSTETRGDTETRGGNNDYQYADDKYNNNNYIGDTETR